MRKEASAYAKAGSSLRKPPVPEHLPPNQDLPTLLSYALTYTSDFTGRCSPTTSLREGVNLQLQLIKIPGCDKSVSTYQLL